MKRQLKKELKLNKKSIQLLDGKSLTDIKGGAGQQKDKPSCWRTSCAGSQNTNCTNRTTLCTR